MYLSEVISQTFSALKESIYDSVQGCIRDLFYLHIRNLGLSSLQMSERLLGISFPFPPFCTHIRPFSLLYQYSIISMHYQHIRKFFKYTLKTIEYFDVFMLYLKRCDSMIERKQYMDKIKKLQNKQIIKVVTGVRRCGKSTLLKQFQQFLLESGVNREQIIDINFEAVENEHLLEYHAMHDYVKERLISGKMTYIFLDEIQAVLNFQKAVDSLFIRENTDIYITGSNAHLLSGELATLLSGRYIEIPMLPLSFAEYLELSGLDKHTAWKNYFQNGGFPYAVQIEDDTIRHDYLDGICHTVLIKNIAARKRINDIGLLESVVKFMFDNIGNIVSSKKIADSLTSFGRKTTPLTAENYVNSLNDAFFNLQSRKI